MLRPPEFLCSNSCDPHDKLSVSARWASLFVRPQVAEYMQDGVSTVVVGQRPGGVAGAPDSGVG